MPAASQLPGRGTTVVDIVLYLQVNQKSDDDDGSTLFANSTFFIIWHIKCYKLVLYYCLLLALPYQT